MTDHFFTGHWRSKHHPLEIEFNENVWRLVNDGHDEKFGSLFGLFSENDGGSFSLDFALKDVSLEYNYEFAESEFFSRMFNLDNHCSRERNFTLLIDGLTFECGQYAFMNKKYGKQTVIRAMHIDNTFVIGIGMAWPEQTSLDSDLPPKYQLLLNHLKIN